MKKIVVVCLLAMSVASCSQSPVKEHRVTVYDPDMPVKKTMLKMTEGIERSLRVLAEVKNAKLKSSMTHEEMTKIEWDNTVVPPNLDTVITVNWNGSPEPVLQMVADYVGYRFIASDKKPAQKSIVRINSVNRSAVDILRDIGVQLGSVGRVRILSQPKIIQLDYGVYVEK